MNTATSEADVLIVGAGHAGAQAAHALRQSGFGGSVMVVGDEPDPPYDRPPLSKEYLAGDKDFERLLLRPHSFWSDRDVSLRLSERVISIDPQAHIAESTRGAIRYGKLIWAGGGRARRLQCHGIGAQGVFTIRRRADIDAIIAMLPRVRKVVVVGAGFIGLEAAAVLTKLGRQVTVLEAAERVLARVAAEPISSFYAAEHRAAGVDLRTRATVREVAVERGVVVGVLLDDGSFLEADLVIVGIGITPEIEALTEAGAAGVNGVDVDEYCRTNLADIYAVGDCAAHVSRYAGGARVRIESVQNANDQARVAAGHILGGGAPYNAVPWFWSNQYDLKLQTVGLAVGYDEVLLRGDPKSRAFSVVYMRDGAFAAIDCVNAAKDFVQARAHVISGAPVDRNRVRDTGVELKALAGAA